MRTHAHARNRVRKGKPLAGGEEHLVRLGNVDPCAAEEKRVRAGGGLFSDKCVNRLCGVAADERGPKRMRRIYGSGIGNFNRHAGGAPPGRVVLPCLVQVGRRYDHERVRAARNERDERNYRKKDCDVSFDGHEDITSRQRALWRDEEPLCAAQRGAHRRSRRQRA